MTPTEKDEELQGKWRALGIAYALLLIPLAITALVVIHTLLYFL